MNITEVAETNPTMVHAYMLIYFNQMIAQYKENNNTALLQESEEKKQLFERANQQDRLIAFQELKALIIEKKQVPAGNSSCCMVM